jgi:peptidoglycan/xylan/chitin deacetylase (PgdA/CDA1 family)
MSESPQRWHLKKAARRSVILASTMSGSVAARRMAGPPRVRALTYHRFGLSQRDPWCVAPDTFEAQMRWLSERRLAVSLDDVLRFATGGGALEDGAVLVTMDDGFSSVWSVAAPILKRYGIPAVAYVTTSAVGNLEAGLGAGEAFLTWEQIAELRAGGMTIGSHGHTHRSMAKLPPAEARDEATRSKNLLEERLGCSVDAFAYAYGMRNDENAATARLLAECGYRSVFISQHGTIGNGADTLRLPRVKVEGGEPLWMFKALCQGGMDAWSLADRLL